MSDDPPVVVCAKTTELTEEQATPGSTRQWCLFCADGVWLSLDGQQFVENDPRAKLVCMDCAVGLMHHEGYTPENVTMAKLPSAVESTTISPGDLAIAQYIIQQKLRERAAE